MKKSAVSFIATVWMFTVVTMAVLGLVVAVVNILIGNYITPYI